MTSNSKNLKTITATDFYLMHQKYFDNWFDQAVAPDPNETHIPVLIDKRIDIFYRKMCLIRRNINVLRRFEIDPGAKIIDVGAGYGTFAPALSMYNPSLLDATDPSVYQFEFMKKNCFAYYNNVFNEGVETLDLSKYDTIYLSGLWLPDWVWVAENILAKYQNLKNVLIKTRFWDQPGFFQLKTKTNIQPLPFGINRPVTEQRIISEKFLSMVMKSMNFSIKSQSRLWSKGGANHPGFKGETEHLYVHWIHYQKR